MTTVLALIVAAGLLVAFLHFSSCAAGEIIHGEIEGDGPMPGAERLPLYAGACILGYLILGQFIVS